MKRHDSCEAVVAVAVVAVGGCGMNELGVDCDDRGFPRNYWY